MSADRSYRARMTNERGLARPSFGRREGEQLVVVTNLIVLAVPF